MEKITDHDAAAKARLAEQYKAKTKLLGIITALTSQIQTTEDAIWQTYAERLLDVAVGTQLDDLGAVVGQERGGSDDTTYRLQIRARVKLNRSSGTGPEILEMFELLIPATVTMELRDEYPAGFTLRLYGATIISSLAAMLVTFLRAATAEGVNGLLEWPEAIPAELFTLDVGPGLDLGKMTGAA